MHCHQTLSKQHTTRVGSSNHKKGRKQACEKTVENQLIIIYLKQRQHREYQGTEFTLFDHADGVTCLHNAQSYIEPEYETLHRR